MLGRSTKRKKESQEALSDPTLTEALTSHLFSTIEAINDEWKEVSKDVTIGIEWIIRVDMTRQAMEFFGQRLNKVDDTFKTFEDFTLEENGNIQKELEGRKHVELEMREIWLWWRLCESLQLPQRKTWISSHHSGPNLATLFWSNVWCKWFGVGCGSRSNKNKLFYSIYYVRKSLNDVQRNYTIMERDVCCSFIFLKILCLFIGNEGYYAYRLCHSSIFDS